ncbi:MAG: response regulator [Planctomycetota bacterium]
MGSFASRASLAPDTTPALAPRPLIQRATLRATVSIPLVFLCGLAFGAFFIFRQNQPVRVLLNIAILGLIALWVGTSLLRKRSEVRPQLLLGIFLLALGATLGFVVGVELAALECVIKTAGVVLVVFAIDRMERARALEDVRGSEKFLESILDSIAEPLFVLGEGCQILALNRCASETFGAALLDARPCDSYLQPRGCEACPVQEVWQKHKPRFEILRDGAGRQRAEVNTFPIMSRGGFSGTLVQRIHDASRSLPREPVVDPISDVVNSVRDAMISLKIDRRVRSVNRAALTMFGLEAEDVIGRPVIDVLRFADPEGRALFEEAIKQDANWEGELVLRSPSGSDLACLVSLAPVYSDEDKLLGPALLIKDLTRLKNLQQQLLQAEKLSAVGELTSGVAHELNNPLAAVCGFTELMLEEVSDDRLRRRLGAVQRHAERCRRIVLNLLRFSRRHAPEKVPSNLNVVIDTALELVAHQFHLEGIEVVRHYDPSLPDTMLDAFQIQQVLINILSNAQQAMKHQTGVRRITIATERTRGDRLCARITDSGPGMSDDVRRRIFDPFFTTKGPGKGTGLGLSVSYGIMRDHGGQLKCESELSKGATFILELPILKGPPTIIASEARVSVDRALHVLVIDDEPVIVEILTALLEGDGHRVTTAANGRQACELLLKGSFDVVLCDVRMPEMSGPELYAWIRGQRPQYQGRVAFLTGDVLSQELTEFVRDTHVALIGKPFKLDQVRRCLAELGKAGAAPAPAAS